MTRDWPEPSTETLQKAQLGDRGAVNNVLDIYRPQLKNVVATRLDSRLAVRMDASDVVQEVLASACDSLAD